MKHIIRKPFWNYEKEEKWLNEMSAKGLALSDYSWCRYVFEEVPEGKYIYRIEYMENPVNHPESKKYFEFLKEIGVEFVASYMKWVYLRKKATEGEFDIYSDIDSRIKHYKRVNVLWNTLAIIEFAVGAINVNIGLAYLITESKIIINLLLGIPLFSLGFIFIFIGRPIRKKIKLLKKEQEIRE